MLFGCKRPPFELFFAGDRERRISRDRITVGALRQGTPRATCLGFLLTDSGGLCMCPVLNPGGEMADKGLKSSMPEPNLLVPVRVDKQAKAVARRVLPRR